MAWSEAARKAAREARKRHGEARRQYSGSSRSITPNDIQTAGASYRRHLAKALRSARATGKTNAHFLSPAQAGRVAAKSTYYRNALRRAGWGK